MEFFSPYILAAIAGWTISQILKYIILSIKGRKLKSVRQLYLSGSMPSAHTATVVAVLIIIGAKDGVGSGLFGLALLFASVVMYDAVMVRRSSGEQGQALTAFIKEQGSKVALPRVAKGHTPFEVLGGAVVGTVVGIIVFITMIG
jgi:acid phosphatase family membrane protein YuiD